MSDHYTVWDELHELLVRFEAEKAQIFVHYQNLVAATLEKEITSEREIEALMEIARLVLTVEVAIRKIPVSITVSLAVWPACGWMICRSFIQRKGRWKKMHNLKAPHIQHYISWLRRLDYGRVGSCISYDEKTYELLDELYLELRKLAPMGDRNRRELWLRAERGSLGDWGNIEEMVEDGEFDCREDAESYWQDMFPDEVYWYHLLTIEDDDTGFRGLFLGHQYIIEVDPEEPESAFPHNISSLAEWLLSEVKRCVVEVGFLRAEFWY